MNDGIISKAEAFGAADGIQSARHAAAKFTPELAGKVRYFHGSWHKRAAGRMLHTLDFGDELQDHEVAHALGVISDDQRAAWVAAEERISQAKAEIDAIVASDPQIGVALSTASYASWNSLQDELYNLAEKFLVEKFGPNYEEAPDERHLREDELSAMNPAMRDAIEVLTAD